MNESIIKDIIKTRNIIRKKFESLKTNKAEDTSKLEELFHPLTTPLNKLIEVADKSMLVSSTPTKSSPSNLKTNFLKWKIKKEKKIKNKTKKYRKPDILHESVETDSLSSEPDHLLKQENEDVEDDEAKENIFEDVHNLGLTSNLSQQDSTVNTPSSTHTTSEYIRLLNINSNDLDNKYGPYISVKDNIWKIGNSLFEMDKENIFINSKVYALTHGLKELVFLKKPDIKQCNNDDILKYLEIVNENNLINRNFDRMKQIAGSRGIKYKLITTLLDRYKLSSTGAGLMNFSTNNIDYIYWDDPNELVNRLRLLIASQNAGHNNHNNEIISILEELQESNVI